MNTKVIVAIAGAFLLAGCSADSGSNGGTGAKVKVFRSVQITAVSGDNITLDGTTTLNTSGAMVSMDDASASAGDLKEGMVVDCKAEMDSDDSGRASEIDYDDEMEGVILAIDGDTMDIMGQTVTKNADTVIEGTLAVDVVVEVSGERQADGSILATRIEVKDESHEDGEEIEVKGTVSELTDTTFMLGNMQVNYENAVVEGNLTDGAYVEVETNQTLDTSNPDSPLMTATEVEVEGDEDDELSDDNADEMEFRGTVTEVTTDDSGAMTGLTVAVINSDQVKTVLVNANTSVEGTIAAETLVEVEGSVDADGTIVASEVEAENSDSGNEEQQSTDDDNESPEEAVEPPVAG